MLVVTLAQSQVFIQASNLQLFRITITFSYNIHSYARENEESSASTLNETNSILIFYSLLAAILFAAINIFSYKIIVFLGKYKGAVLSLFGGITASYVFLDLLPSLQISSQFLTTINSSLTALYEDAIFLVAFVGFLVYFILEHMTISFRDKRTAEISRDSNISHAEKGIFAVHLFTFSFLSFILSFVLLFQYQTGIIVGLLYTIAVSLHLFIFEGSIFEQYKELQAKIGRYVTGFIPLAGWAASIWFPERIAEAYVLLAFISGAILYNSIRNEIPSVKREKSLILFLVGVLIYSLLLISEALAHAGVFGL